MIDILIPMFCILLGIIGLTVYVLVVALKGAMNQIVKTNQQLLIMVGSVGGNETAARALVAAARTPNVPIPGVSTPKSEKKDEKPKEKQTITVGIR